VTVCAYCGQPAVNLHHIARRANHPTLMAPVCRACHYQLTRWHLDAGVPGRAGWEPTEVDQARAVVIGITDFMELLYKHRDWSSGWRRLGRVAALVMGATVTAVPGWGPDPVGARRRSRFPSTSTPTTNSTAAEVDEVAWATEALNVVVSHAEEVCGAGHPIPELARRLIDPEFRRKLKPLVSLEQRLDPIFAGIETQPLQFFTSWSDSEDLALIVAEVETLAGLLLAGQMEQAVVAAEQIITELEGHV
jgi:hypothetical protein